MPFIAECPFCKKGRLKCPDHAVGWSGTCPNPECGLSFTIVKGSLAPPATPSGPRRRPRITSTAAKRESAPAHRGAAGASPVSSSTPLVAGKRPAEADTAAAMSPVEAGLRSIQDSSAPPPESQDSAPARPRAVGLAAPEAAEDEAPPRNRWPINGLSATSMFCSGVALVWASLAPGLLVPLIAGGLAVAVGLAGFVMAKARERGVGLAAVGPGVGLLAAILVAFFPAALNPRRALEVPPGPAASQERQFVPLKPSAGQGAGQSEPAPEWIDASKGAAQFGSDLWLRVTAVTVAPVEFPPEKRFTTEKWLIIRLQAANNGTARQLDYAGWADSAAGSSAHPVTLRDSAGRIYRQKAFATDAPPLGQLRRGVLMPGKWLDDLLVFDPPAESVQSLRLELPLSAFGMKGEARWLIPRSMIVFK